jgi:hypothetical protein
MTSSELKEIAIVGFAPRTKHLAHKVPESVEIWSPNWAWKHDLPRINRLFELHQWEALRAEDMTSQQHYAWLCQPHLFPVYTLPGAHPDFPSAVAYPFEEVCALLGERLKWGERPLQVFTSTFDYMMALAIYEGVERVRLIGVEMESETEYSYQRPGMAFWLGVPLAAGGLLEQPFGRTQRMLAAKTVYDAFRLYANSPLSDVEFSRRFPEAWEVVTHIESSAFDA